MNLMLDFDFIEQSSNQELPKYMARHFRVDGHTDLAISGVSKVAVQTEKWELRF